MRRGRDFTRVSDISLGGTTCVFRLKAGGEGGGEWFTTQSRLNEEFRRQVFKCTQHVVFVSVS